MRARPLILVFALFGAVCGVAHAQVPTYAPDTPAKRALYRDGSTERYLLAGTWLFQADRGNTGIAQGLWRGRASTSGWSPVTVPNAYNAGDTSTAGMVGYVGWYRKDFLVPPRAFSKRTAADQRRWVIRFESVNYRATVWLNGRLVGSHVVGYEPFEFDLPALRSGVNRLIVRIDNRRSGADIPPGGFYSNGATPVGGWWNYGGLLREVYLRAVDGADLEQVQVRPLLRCSSCAAQIIEQATVRNLTGVPLPVTLTGSYGGAFVNFGSTTIAAHGVWTPSASVTIAHPRLWSPDHPTLYRASLTLTGARGRRLAGYVTYSGVRQIAVTADGRLRLNGRALRLRGVGLQEADPTLGAALDPAHLRRMFSWVRELGATVIRSHYPLNPEIQELADRSGVLIWSEIPVYQVPSQYLTNPRWLSLAHSMLQNDILTNQNHPSVLLWSIGNELATPPDGPETAYIKGAAKLAHALDPTRPVAMAVSSWPGIPCQAAYGPLDVIGFNEYFGWYDAAFGGTADRDQLGPYLDAFRACYPRKAVFVSEFGFEANRQGPIEERGTYAFQDNSVLYHLGVFNQKPWLAGAIYWALQDFLCRPGWTGGNPWPDPPYFHKGLIDLTGVPKPAFADVAAAFRAIAQIAPQRG